eukprot:TRINITY_DN18689_c0_g1_i1.p1 TRINITY_DN18689_c0_g1~~TRINITY_DN18689_c0_g1_i1.p1  ORF type:complete len:293 (+),score=73.21 TRINITY_DN18689_c0_g1_i1:84-962(+)
MFRRTVCVLYGGKTGHGTRGVAQDMIAVWRLYGDRVGEVHASVEGLHWSVDDHMLESYLQMFAKTRDVRVDRESLHRRGAYDPLRKRGKSLGTAHIIFKSGQDGALAQLFGTRHVLQGRELRMFPSDDQPKFNFYIPNTSESDAEGMDPDVVHKMADQVTQLGVTVTGKFANPKLRHLQRVKDQHRARLNRDAEKNQAASEDEPWFYGMGEHSWDDLGEDPQRRGSPNYKPHWADTSHAESRSHGRATVSSSVSDFVEQVASEQAKGLDRVDIKQTNDGKSGRESRVPKAFS